MTLFKERQMHGKSIDLTNTPIADEMSELKRRDYQRLFATFHRSSRRAANPDRRRIGGLSPIILIQPSANPIVGNSPIVA